MEQNDIAFFLSGGLRNTNPVNSIGGQMSRQKINHGIDNLFNDVTSSQSSAGSTDYRCFYIINKSSTERLKDLSLYIHKELEGCTVLLGLSLQSEVQALIINGFPDKYGYFKLQYTLKQSGTTHFQTTREIFFDSNTSNMANRIAATLNSLDQLRGIEVIGQESSTGYDFLITFSGSSSGRAQEVLTVVENDTGSNITTMRVTAGSPINSTAPNIGMSNNMPSGVTFYNTGHLEPVKVGTFYPEDYMPIWLQRITPQNVTPVHPDHCGFHLIGKPIPALKSKRKQKLD